nr:hypothetical protein CFP56_67589 [Quercus suber]
MASSTTCYIAPHKDSTVFTPQSTALAEQCTPPSGGIEDIDRINQTGSRMIIHILITSVSIKASIGYCCQTTQMPWAQCIQHWSRYVRCHQKRGGSATKGEIMNGRALMVNRKVKTILVLTGIIDLLTG